MPAEIDSTFLLLSIFAFVIVILIVAFLKYKEKVKEVGNYIETPQRHKIV